MPHTDTQAESFTVAWDREETEPCQRGTAGCCVDHKPAEREQGCQCW
ncbi:hypothetical protein [Actinomadura violacea]|uniref:Uncharacterized protein n=1 Tax=Actinomadura violacea TaxID=2819934 RepID=A0ABS3RY34_9ACTN|nr:hypothetical protein [Actinomadura violacea]MBO2461674.1 hypothetical protein [Actinomadura violacea]